MFCPQCGHQQPSNEMRFCSRCGLSLGLATDLLPTSGNQLQREKRELMGVGLMTRPRTRKSKCPQSRRLCSSREALRKRRLAN